MVIEGVIQSRNVGLPQKLRVMARISILVVRITQLHILFNGWIFYLLLL